MSRMPWFRMYSEARNDAKLRALTPSEFVVWFRLLCLSAEHDPRGVIDFLDPELVAIEVGVNTDELVTSVGRMQRLKLVVEDGGYLYFPAFADRQYDHPSDRPEATRERQRRRREKLRGPVDNCLPFPVDNSTIRDVTTVTSGHEVSRPSHDDATRHLPADSSDGHEVSRVSRPPSRRELEQRRVEETCTTSRVATETLPDDC